MALTFAERIPEVPSSTVPVYELQPPPSGRDSGDRLAELSRRLDRLGLRGESEELESGEEWTRTKDGPHILGVHAASGALVYQNEDRYQMLTDRPFELSDDEAYRLTQEFVESTELIPSGEMRFLGVTHLQSGGGDPKGQRGRVVTIDAGVVHGRQLDRVPVVGPGGMAMVNIDPEGQIVGFRVTWRPVRAEAGEANLLPPDHAYEVMERVAGKVKGDVNVVKAEFGYFEQGVLDRQQYLQPAYTLIYEVTDGEVAYKSVEVVAASEKEFEPLLGEKRFRAEQQEPRKPVR